MKAFSIAVAVTLVLAFLCLVVESSALPFAGEPEPREDGSQDTPGAVQADEPAQGWTMPGLVREKRQSHLSLCRFCCNCCRNKGCGPCCKF